MAFKICCAIKDRAADCFMLPFFVPSRAVAVRMFADEVNRPAEDNMIFRHPDDFDLYFLATFNDDNASFQVEQLEVMARAKDLVKEKANV